MSENIEVVSRREMLAADLSKMISHYQSLGKSNYFTAYCISLISVGASLIAGIGGLSLKSPLLFAFVAFIPAAVAIIAASFKLQDRANWHYRKKDALNGLRNSLLFELPDPPTCESIAIISRQLTDLNVTMSRDWEQSFGWDSALKHKS